jgi:hypothetical protein
MPVGYRRLSFTARGWFVIVIAVEPGQRKREEERAGQGKGKERKEKPQPPGIKSNTTCPKPQKTKPLVPKIWPNWNGNWRRNRTWA